MNKSLLKILVATVAVSATVATTVFAVRKLKKNKTKDKEEVTKEKSEDSENLDETNDNLNSDDASDIELKIKQCMEKPLTDKEMLEDNRCHSNMINKILMNKGKNDPIKEYHEYMKNKYVYLTENHFKKLPEVT